MTNYKIISCFLLIFLNFLFSQINIFSQWNEQNSGVNKNLNQVIGTLPAGTFLICGDSGTILKTSNSGTNWVNMSGNGIPSNINLKQIYSVYWDINLFAAGESNSSAYIFFTSNGGNNWIQVFSQQNSSIVALSYYMFIGNPVGGRWSIWKRINNGYTWDSTGLYLPQAGNEYGWLNSFCSDGSDYSFVFGTNNSRLYKRNNTTWSTISTLPETNIYAICWVPNQRYGYIGGSNLLYTADWGSTWQQISAPGNNDFVSIVSQTGLYTTWYVRKDNKIYYKDYNGSWTYSYISPLGDYMNMGNIVLSQTDLFAVRNNGKISYRFISPPPLGINLISPNVPESFSLSQNYPNPFNPTTKIRFSVPAPLSSGEGPGVGSHAKLIIYDILSREIQTIVNEQLSPGIYEVEFDGTNYPSGVYYYMLTTENFSETKKMVILK